MLNKTQLEELEAKSLAPYAMLSRDTRGRDHEIGPDELRTEFQRDRDRIIHSSAFRKLEYKTQVYMVHYGDYFRTRITHTMEVAQIARTLARNLSLNQDLTEAIALAHDLGHTPFGHSGEAALRRLLQQHGSGFEHNEQGLRVVEFLEERSPRFPGLNLTWEVREGIIKHDTEYDSPSVPPHYRQDLAPTLESQVCDVADEIAYNNHDIDDALKMRLITERDLKEVDWVWDVFIEARASLPEDTRDKYIKFKAIGVLIAMQVADVLKTSTENIERLGIRTVDDVRARQGRVIGFSKDMAQKNRRLKDFLFRRVYRHPSLVRASTKSERLIERLFNLYMEIPEQLPLKYQGRIEKEGLPRVVTDYISGMTDRYLQDEYVRAFEPTSIGARGL